MPVRDARGLTRLSMTTAAWGLLCCLPLAQAQTEQGLPAPDGSPEAAQWQEPQTVSPATRLEAEVTPAAAATQAESDASTLQEVRIYGTAEKDVGFAPKEAETAGKAPMRILDTPQSISVVTREEMESRQTYTLQQALQTVAGVSPVNYGRRGFDDLFMRGFRSTESILIDGLVQSPGLWTRLQSYGYERFEVLKGANSVLYGQMQPGGLVNAISKRPRAEAMGEVHAEVGSFGHRLLGADVNRPLSESGKTALRLNMLAANDKDPTDHVYRRDRWVAPSLSLDFGPNTDFVLFATYANGNWIRQQGTTPYGTVLPNVNGEVPFSLFTGDPSFGPYDVDQYTLGYSVQHRLANGATFRQNVRYEDESGTGNFIALQALQRNQRLQNRRGTRQELDYDIISTDTSMLFNATTGALKHQLVAGLDARRSNSRLALRRCTIGALDLFAPVYGMEARCPAAHDRDDPTRLTAVGVYAQDQIRFGQGWTVLAGLRHERSRLTVDDRVRNRVTTQKDGKTTGSFGIVHEFAEGWSVYGSHSRSFLPTSGQDVAGNLFKPETGQQWELGLKYVLGGISASAAIYDLRRQNIAVSDPANEGFSVQVGEQRSRGLELEAGLDLRNGWKVSGAYAFTDAEVTRDGNAALVGKPINMTPKHGLVLWADWRVPQLPALTLGFGGRYVSTQKAATYAFDLPSYTVADLSASYTFDQVRVTAGVRNLFDRKYYDGAITQYVVSPALPRTYTLTVKYLF